MKWILLLAMTGQCCLAEATPTKAEQFVQKYAAQYRVPPELIAALIDVESAWNPQATSTIKSKKGVQHAMGIMQLLPSTATRFGALQPYDVEQNIAAGTRYVTTLMWEFHGDLRLVAAAYYAGDRWVGKEQLNYRNPDVVAYVEKVRQRYIKRRFAAAIPPRR
jgi:soluble lytic murein transglycosylase